MEKKIPTEQTFSLYFRKPQKSVQAVVKIPKNQYDKVCKIRDESGVSIIEILNKLLEYAFDHWDGTIKEECDGFLLLRGGADDES